MILKLSQVSVPLHLGEFSTSGFAGIIAPVHVTIGLLSETVPDAGVALKELGKRFEKKIKASAQIVSTSETLRDKLDLEMTTPERMVLR